MTNDREVTRRKIMTTAGMGALVAGGLINGTEVLAPKSAHAQPTQKKKGADRKQDGSHPKLQKAIDAMLEAKEDIEKSLPRSRNAETRKLREKAITAIEVAIIDLKLIIQS